MPAANTIEEPVLRDMGTNDMNTSDSGAPTGNRIIRRHGRGVQRQYRVSDTFYGDTAEDEDSTTRCSRFADVRFGHTVQSTYDVKKIHSRQSRRLPAWIWYVLTRLLGIRLHPADRPIFGTIMYIVTLTFAAGYIVTFTWFTVYDIMSTYTKQTVLTGLVSIMIVLYWCALGVYANNLASKLFSSQKFVDSVRLHTRTVFKVSAAGLMILIATTSTILNDYNAATHYSADLCRNMTVSPAVCYSMFATRVGFSVFSLVWNLLVGIVLLSVCRTHTIGIRRFIKQLEEDGRVYELYMRNLYMQGPMGMSRRSDITQITDDEHYEWDEHDLSPMSEDGGMSPASSPAHRHPHQGFTSGVPSGLGQIPTLGNPGNHGNTGGGVVNACMTPEPSVGLLTPEGRRVQTDTASELLIDITIEPSPADNTTVAPPVSSSMDMLTGASGVAMTPEPKPSPCRAAARSSPAPMSSEPPFSKPRPFRPENRPIIIIKEGSIAASEDNEADLMNPKTTSAEETINIDNLKPEASIPLVRQDGRTDSREHTTQLINPDPPSYASRSTQHSMRVELSSPRRIPSSMTGDSEDTSTVDNLSMSPNMLSQDNILLCYWRIGCRLRSTSIALQRWLMAWVVFILVWSVTFIVSWIHHEATLLEIAAFVLPILLLPLVCSAYGEVNMEGRRMLQCVCPTEERVHMLLFLENQPLQLTAFGFPINYSTILKTIGALAAAFCTKVILEEFSVF